eukprot:TRINITY_DN633_c0_g1_i1.p1 TRINITY_DN633_c0_g1~~TRINITY_DN633_c0_g1_i1.p1  ORF type:complete len:666 (-),score=187.80 TRINITY_DN633_c0_g1_i1:161-2158(-)
MTNPLVLLVTFALLLSVQAQDIGIDCNSCVQLTSVIQQSLARGASETAIQTTLTQACIQARLLPETVCRDFIYTYGPAQIKAVRRAGSASAAAICGFQNYCPFTFTPAPVVTFPKAKPTHVPRAPVSPYTPKKKIVQISDTHIDTLYVEGSSTVCPRSLTCCHAEYGPGNATLGTAAGYWGSYECDLPIRTLHNALAEIKKQNPDIILVSGDLISGDVFRVHADGVIATNAYLFTALRQVFGPNVRIIPTLGNHDTDPTNFLDLPDNAAWLFNPMAQLFSSLNILSGAPLQSFLKRGFYSVNVEPGLRAIALETVYYSRQNLFLFNNYVDPAGQLAWLVSELQDAEDKGDRVYIIGHIPPGHGDAIPTLGDQLYQIVNRYEDTIVSLFFGHRHVDSFEVFYTQDDQCNKRATAIAYVSPSLITRDFNPTYRVYNYEVDTKYITDSYTYFFNLTEANYNAPAEPVWMLAYSAREAYQLASLSPVDWDKAANKIQFDQETFRLFYDYHQHLVSQPCEGQCKVNTICHIRSGSRTIYDQCVATNATAFHYGHVVPPRRTEPLCTYPPAGTFCSAVALTQTLVNVWPGGSQWNGLLINTGSQTVSLVQIFAADYQYISNLWILAPGSAPGTYVNPSYIPTLAPGQSLQFGYTATSQVAVSFSVTAVTCV